LWNEKEKGDFMGMNEAGVKTDGIYYREKENGRLDYFHFYGNGTVVNDFISGLEELSFMLKEIKRRWGDEERPGVPKGKYTIDDDKISFSTLKTGVIDYNGKIYNDKLILDLHSHINGYEAKNLEYVFAAFPEDPPKKPKLVSSIPGGLTWDDYDELGRLLAEKYPDISPRDLSKEEIIQKVKELEGFSCPEPDDIDVYLTFITTRWNHHRWGGSNAWYPTHIGDICP
jgi:Fe-S-cluster formation regulator IscX/YfhJ